MSARRRAGFSLLEVLIAMAILAISLTALFSGEAGAVKMAYRARRIGVATLLARCKMGEIEEQIALEGLPAVSDTGSDECCEDAEVDGFTCDWEIERIVIPETVFAPEEGEDDPMAALTGDQGSSADPAQAATQIAGQALNPSATDPGSLMSGASSMLAGGGSGSGLAGMAMSYAFPILKPSFEEQIRRATVTVRWKEGTQEKTFDITQYLVAEQGTNALDPNAPGGTGTQGTGTPGQPGSNTGAQGTPGLPGIGGLLGGGK